MNEIEVGEYIRTKQGYIAKLENKSDKYLMFNNPIYCYYEESPLLPINEELLDGRHIKAKEYITKHSFNIIDLIEICDYVNGREVIGKYFNENGEITLIVDTRTMKTKITNGGIKTILTHEQYEQDCYKVGDIDE